MKTHRLTVVLAILFGLVVTRPATAVPVDYILFDSSILADLGSFTADPAAVSSDFLRRPTGIGNRVRKRISSRHRLYSRFHAVHTCRSVSHRSQRRRCLQSHRCFGRRAVRRRNQICGHPHGNYDGARTVLCGSVGYCFGRVFDDATLGKCAAIDSPRNA